MNDLEMKTRNALSEIHTELLKSVIYNASKRMHLCIENSGGYLEHVLNSQSEVIIFKSQNTRLLSRTYVYMLNAILMQWFIVCSF